MLRNLLSTTASRLIIAIINLGIIWICARYLGAEILGTISLIVLGISIIQLVTAVLAGSALVYQTSRNSVAELLIIAWLWILVAGVPVWILLKAFSLIPEGFNTDVLLLSFLGSIITVNQNIFLGKEKVNWFNSLAVLQSIMVLLPLLIFVLIRKWYDTQAYVTAQYISMSAMALVGTLINFPPFRDFKWPRLSIVVESFRYGGYLQTANFLQLFNYRLSYYIIEKFFDRATLGVFSVGVQIAESVWIIGRSMAVLLFSRVSNSRDQDYSIQLTVQFLKLTGLTTIALIGLLMLLPTEFFVWVFRSDFNNIKLVIISLSPGIVSVSLSLMFSHYFSGTGKPHYNTIASLIGLVFTLVLGFTLIPLYGLTGAGLTSSISYLSGVIYQIMIFRRITGVKWRGFVPDKTDMHFAIKQVKDMFAKVS
jgi:O-antigen/teichoic acid export membrane protein